MPKISIITTVYDRHECLRQAIASVQQLNFKDYEHIVVSDCPPDNDLAKVKQVVVDAQDTRVRYYNLSARHNNWGIAPASFGLKQAQGQYVAFLSDDNGYLQHHFDALVAALDADAGLSFVYSGCYYLGEKTLVWPIPEHGKIDLGQPLLRRQVFKTLYNDDLPFSEYNWDWRMISEFTTQGGYKFIADPTFIFRLCCYPQFAPLRGVGV